MKNSYIFFAGISNIAFPVVGGSGERYADSYVITSDRVKIRNIVKPFYDALGSVECDYLCDEVPAIIYKRENWDGELKDTRDILENKMIENLLVVQKLFLSLWLTKDNSATLDNGWVFITGNGKFVAHTNTWSTRPSCSDGRYDIVSFDVEEFRQARRGFNIDSGQQIYLSGKSDPTLLISKSLRFQRFLYLIGGARSAVDVAIKIALYCSALESLVSTAQTELSHQVSERIATLLAPRGPQRIATFSLIKEAYGYRSKAVHGASFKGTAFERLRAASVQIDEICRRLSILYLEDGKVTEIIEGGDENLNAHFIELVLGEQP